MTPNSSIPKPLQTNCPHSSLLDGPRGVVARRLFLTLLFLCTTSVTGAAQNAPTAPTPSAVPGQTLPDVPSASRENESKSFGDAAGNAVKTIGLDEWNILKAPFQKKALIWDGLVLGATGVLIANDESVAQQVPVSWHQTGVNISDACTYGTAAVAGGIYVTGLFTHDEHAQRTGVLAAEASIDSFLLYGSMKLIFARQRPYTSPGDGKFFAGNFSGGSFPSGHSAFAWTLASVVAHEYPKWPVQLAMYGLGNRRGHHPRHRRTALPFRCVCGIDAWGSWSAGMWLIRTNTLTIPRTPATRSPGCRARSSNTSACSS